MPDKKRYEIGQIVFLEEDGEMKPYKIKLYFDYFDAYILRSCGDDRKIVEVHANQLRSAEEYNATIVDGKAIVDALRDCNNGYDPRLTELSDEEIDQMAPPVHDTHLVSPEQEAYSFMYNAICSAENIISVILRCATSDKRLSDAELLAMRDRAEELGAVEIVHMIDRYFEEGENDE